MIEMLLTDCMDFLKDCPDKAFELAIVDPPYGVGFGDYERGSSGVKVQKRYTSNGKKRWDDEIPPPEYFQELFRVSVNQIIWGGNNFELPTTQGFIFWYKRNPVPNFADGEYAWTSFQYPAKCYDFMYYGNINTERDRTHPTQKPIALYRWLLHNYAKPGDRILDTHGGSGSSAIACHQMGFDMVWMEKDKDYYDAACKRFKEQTAQEQLFAVR